MKTKTTIDYNVQIWQEGSQFIAHAMPLDVMSSGRSPDEARDALDQAVELFIETAIEAGTFEEVLQDAGYLVGRDRLTSPPWVAFERHSMALDYA
ncbi:MAG: hypothetical protein K1X65_10860 [Caldilineales bacterium]|nr:hypothetical protein [Caldilineales bacterium]MCW5856713.1 hypothetical protein [Caldilineales bacterium]